MPRYVTHLESGIDGTRLDPEQPHTLHKDRPLWVRYDLDAVRRAMTKESLRGRPASMWRYRELLPLETEQEPVSLGEGMSPLLHCLRLGRRLGLSDVWIKDESQIATGSFKARGMSAAVTMARRFGIRCLAVPTAGNAGGACAAYAARAGMEAYVFMPDDTPAINQYEARLCGARAFLVNGLITDCGRIVREGKQRMGWFDLSTLKEPYRIEGKKTMGLELAEQFDWRLPDVILYPTGGGTGLIGMWKAFAELAAIGWLNDDKRPRMVAVQSDGCCPIVRAFEAGERFAQPFQHAATIASGIRVPAAVGDFMILDAVRESGGRAVAVEEGRIREWMRLACESEGIAVCPESATCVGALDLLAREGWIKPDERVVIFNTGASQKYVEAIASVLPRIDHRQPLDWDRIAGG
jgi:threonine synthase